MYQKSCQPLAYLLETQCINLPIYFKAYLRNGVYVCVCLHECPCGCPYRPKENITLPELRVIGSHGPPNELLGLKSNPLPEEQTLLPSEACL